MLRRLILPAAAATLAVMVTAPLVADHASARPIAPIAGPSVIERLRAENQALRMELQVALDQRDEIAAGLDRIEQLERSSRDHRTARRVLAFIRDLEARTGLDQRWDYDDWYHRPDYPPTPGYPGYPGHPSTPPGPPPYPPSTGPGHPPTPPSPPPVVFPPGHPRGPAVITDRRTHVGIGVVAMNAADFAALLATVNGAGFTEQQLSIIKGAADRSYFTVDQVVALMGAARFEEARIEIAVTLGNRVVDMDRWFLIERAFSFSDSSATVRARLGR